MRVELMAPHSRGPARPSAAADYMHIDERLVRTWGRLASRDHQVWEGWGCNTCRGDRVRRRNRNNPMSRRIKGALPPGHEPQRTTWLQLTTDRIICIALLATAPSNYRVCREPHTPQVGRVPTVPYRSNTYAERPAGIHIKGSAGPSHSAAEGAPGHHKALQRWGVIGCHRVS